MCSWARPWNKVPTTAFNCTGEKLDAAFEMAQLWYDQYLPPVVSEAHKDTCQELFGLTMTPEEANKELQKTMDEYNSSHNEE